MIQRKTATENTKTATDAARTAAADGRTPAQTDAIAAANCGTYKTDAQKRTAKNGK